MSEPAPVQQDPLQAAARILVERRGSGQAGARLEMALRPTSVEQALAIQAAGATLWCERHDDQVIGWKTGLPLPGNGDEPQKLIVAPLFASTIHRTAPVSLWCSRASVDGAPIARMEPELAFVLAADLPARGQPYTRTEVEAAVGQVHMALELIHCRYAEPASCSFEEKLADCLENQGLFIGPVVARQLAFTARTLSLALTSHGETRILAGRHPANDPVAPLCWLAEFLRSRGQGLRAGQMVITGCYAEKVLEVALQQPIALIYTNDDEQVLGQLRVEFRQKTTRQTGGMHD